MTRSRKLAQATIQAANGTCWQCGCTDKPLEADHILPLELTGTDTADNMQALCGDCHLSKTRQDIKRIAKARRIRKKAEGFAPKWKRRLGSAKWKRKVNGEVVAR